VSAARKKAPSNPIRNGLIRKVQVARRELGLDDDSYRDLVERVTGKRSAGDCSVTQLEALVDELRGKGFKPKRAPKRAGNRKMADGAEVAKARALWISLYHLGVVRDPSEKALAAYAERVTGGRNKGGTAALQWLTPQGCYQLIEALKAWAARPVREGGGGVDWSGYLDPISGGTVYRPRRRVVEAQIRVLMGAGALPAETFPQDVLRQRTGRPGWWAASDTEIDQLIEALGTQVREVR